MRWGQWPSVRREEDKTEENVASKCSQPEKNRVDQATGEAGNIFDGGNGWGKNSAPTLAPHTLVIPRGASMTMTEESTAFPMRGNYLRQGKQRKPYTGR